MREGEQVVTTPNGHSVVVNDQGNVVISQHFYDELIEARTNGIADRARAGEYLTLLCRFKGLAEVYAANFDYALMNVSLDPRAKR